MTALAPTRILLSVCIASIYTRGHFLAKLLANINPQLGPHTELLLDIDGGQRTTGDKRQRLLEMARGDYVVSLDDDDLVSPDYFCQVIAAIHRNPADCITYKSKRYRDGVYDGDCIYSLVNPRNETVTREGVKTYLRFPFHVTPIRRELALKAGFKSLNRREDVIFAETVKPLLRTEEFIDAFLYEYWWRSKRDGETTNKALTGQK